MAEIYVARGADGAVKYLADVPSGLACDCTCLWCGGPMVAKKGAINEWHFAHENGQTHVNCLVGARNHLRRTAAQVLARMLPYSRIQPYAASLTWKQLTDRIELTDAVESLELAIDVSRAKVGIATVVARGVTVRERLPFQLQVQCDGEQVEPNWDPGVAQLLLCIPQLDPVTLRSETSTHEAIASSMRLHWLHMPDAHSAVRSALQALQTRYDRLKALHAEGDRRGQGGPLPLQRSGSRFVPTTAPPPVAPASVPPPAWTAMFPNGQSLFCYRFHDGSFWLLGPTSRGWMLHPWPWAEDGWDESLPPSVGVPDPDFEAYACGQQFLDANLRLRDWAASLSNCTEQTELCSVFAKLGWTE